MMDLVIKNGTVVTGGWMRKLDIGVKDGKITMLADAITEEAAHVADAEGRLIFPGGVDCHAHLNEPGYTWREDYGHGTKSAAAGGVTTVVDMPLQNTPSLTSKAAFLSKKSQLAGRSYIDYAFWGGLIDTNLDEVEGMYEAGAPALKAFISPASPDFPSAPLGVVHEAMKKAARLDRVLGFHCEDYSLVSYYTGKAKAAGKNTWRDYLDSRPVVAEEMAVQNILDMAEDTGARIHICHVSHPKVAERIRAAQKKGLPVTAETCPHYLIFTEEDLIEKQGTFKCSPPLRTREAVEGLWEYVLDGTLSSIVSDHSPAAPAEKSSDLSVWDIWGGISGLQTGLAVLYEYGVNRRHISPCLLAKAMAANAADTFRLAGKGKIQIGYDGDLVIFNPQKPWKITPETLYYLNPISAFCGLEGTGAVEATYLRGRKVYGPEGVAAEKAGHLIEVR